MTLNLKGNGRAIAKLGKKLIFVDPTDTNGMKVINTQNNEENILTQVPSIDTRETLYIAGRSGSGKSTYAKEYIKNYSKLFPNNKIYLISKVDDDVTFKDIKNIIKIDPDLFNSDESEDNIDYDAKQFKNCIVIFDDIDQFVDKIKKPISLLRDQLLEIGRHNNVYVISTSHLLTNYKHTRVLLNEAHSVTFFPQSGFHNIERYLKQYAGLSNENINQIKNSKSRWVTVFQSYPQVIMEEHKIYIP